MKLENLPKERLIKKIQEQEELISKLQQEKYLYDLKYEIDVIDEDSFVKSTSALKACFQNGPYKSLRQFASRVGLAPGKVSEIFSGKRYLSLTLLEKIQNSKEFSAEFIGSLKTLIEHETLERRRSKAELKAVLDNKHAPVEKIDGENYNHMDDWTFYAILALLEKKEKQTIESVTETLKIPPLQTKRSLDILLSIKMIFVKDGHYGLKISDHTFSANKPKEAEKALRLLTNSILKKSQEVYNQLNFPIKQADYINFSLLACPQRMTVAKKMLANYMYKVCQFLSEGEEEKREVYFLNAQVFPVAPE